MSFKTVFLAVGSTDDDSEIDRAAAICDQLGAHLALLVLGIAPPPPASPYGVVSNDVWAGEIREGQGEAQVRAEAVEARLGAARRSPSRSRASTSTAAPWRRWRRASPATPTSRCSRRSGRATRRCSPG